MATSFIEQLVLKAFEIQDSGMCTIDHKSQTVKGEDIIRGVRSQESEVRMHKGLERILVWFA